MADNAIGGLGSIRKLEPAQYDTMLSELQEGELIVSQGEDASEFAADFRGNGETTATEVVARVIELNPLNDELMASFKDVPDAAKYAATALLMKGYNLHLRNQSITAEKPIPSGELFRAKHSEMKLALAPFKGKLAELRKSLENTQALGELSSDQARTIGDVRTQGRTLPVDPKF